jgi:hypothetical protein
MESSIDCGQQLSDGINRALLRLKSPGLLGAKAKHSSI